MKVLFRTHHWFDRCSSNIHCYLLVVRKVGCRSVGQCDLGNTMEMSFDLLDTRLTMVFSFPFRRKMVLLDSLKRFRWCQKVSEISITNRSERYKSEMKTLNIKCHFVTETNKLYRSCQQQNWFPGIPTIGIWPSEFRQCRNSSRNSKFFEIPPELRQYWRMSTIVDFLCEFGQ